MKVAWLSAGVSSFVAAYLADPDELLYIDIDDQHPDSRRFIADCSRVLKKDVQVLRSEYRSVENVCKTFRYVNGPAGARCTQALKKRVRKTWESQQTARLEYVWGFDCTEERRADRLVESMPWCDHVFPLIDRQLTKEDAHAICERLGVKRPVMYDMGYRNNNCIGCVKGGKGYWNKIRRDFPEVFARRAAMEREIGHSCIKGVYLDELDPHAGRNSEVMPSCSIMRELAIEEEDDE